MRIRSVSVLVGCVALEFGLLATAAAQQVGPSIHVSEAYPGIPHAELLAAADPANPKRMLACTMVYDPARQQRSSFIYSAFDGGGSWIPTLREESSRFVGDPTCVYGLGDTAYAAVLPIYKGIDRDKWIAIYRSVDGGRNWALSTKLPFIDREYLDVDRTAGPWRGRLYLYAIGERLDSTGKRAGAQLQLLYSADGGTTFSAPVATPGAENYTLMTPGVGAILHDGTILIPFMAKRDGKSYIEVTTSSDGGQSLTAPVEVASFTRCERAGSGLGINAAVDRSEGPFVGRVYVVFASQTSGRCEVQLAYSTDRGKTWSDPATVNDDRPPHSHEPHPGDPLAHHSQPAVAVNNRGVVAVSWYDRRDNPNDLGYTPRFAASLDGGQSFLPSVELTSASFDRTASREYFVDAYVSQGGATSENRPRGSLVSIIGPDNYYFQGAGDTRDMVVDANGVFYPFWYDNRTGVMQLWTAPVHIDRTASLHGDPALDGLIDVTDKVTLEYRASRHDPVTDRIETDVVLVNKSDQPIVGPIKMRVTRLSSAAATVQITNAINGHVAAGAIWDFTGALTNGVLPARSESRPITLAFQLSDIDASRLSFALINLTTRVVAKEAPGLVQWPPRPASR